MHYEKNFQVTVAVKVTAPNPLDGVTQVVMEQRVIDSLASDRVLDEPGYACSIVTDQPELVSCVFYEEHLEQCHKDLAQTLGRMRQFHQQGQPRLSFPLGLSVVQQNWDTQAQQLKGAAVVIGALMSRMGLKQVRLTQAELVDAPGPGDVWFEDDPSGQGTWVRIRRETPALVF